jgi:hypothetical protein
MRNTLAFHAMPAVLLAIAASWIGALPNSDSQSQQEVSITSSQVSLGTVSLEMDRMTATDDRWDAGYIPPGTNAKVNAVVVDGAGNVYAGGEFTRAGSIAAKYVAMWDGRHWHDLGAGLGGYVYALALDSQGRLYAAGWFSLAGGEGAQNIARWDGESWSALGSGCDDAVSTLAVDGNDNLFVGGPFARCGDLPVNNVAKWDGEAWSDLGGGTNGAVWSLAIDASGSVYAGGIFTEAGGDEANRLARWDGERWQAMGGGVINSKFASVHVRSIVIDAAGRVVVGGLFTHAGGVAASNIARWDGEVWTAVGEGANGSVGALVVDDNSHLYASGNFSYEGGSWMARWDGTSWTAAGPGLSWAPSALATDGTGRIYVGGQFTDVGTAIINNIAVWDGARWHALGDGVNSPVRALAVDARGTVYAAGESGDSYYSYITGWDGRTRRMVSYLRGTVRALAIDDADVLYVAGDFTSVGRDWGLDVTLANHIARWDGTAWSALGEGLNGEVRALAIGSNGDLYAAGDFTLAGGLPANHIARWDGETWHALGAGTDGPVYTLAADPAGGVYVGGRFLTAGDVEAPSVARWNGTEWVALGTGLHNGRNINTGVYSLGRVLTLVLDANGAVLAGGNFATDGANNLAEWDGSTWTAVAGDYFVHSMQSYFEITALAVGGDGRLYIAGGFHLFPIDGRSPRVAVWDGFDLKPLGRGVDGTVHALALVGDSLYLGGEFLYAGGRPSPYFARSTVPDAPATGISGDGPEPLAGLILQQNYPNPFSLETTIRFSLPHSANVRLSVYDLLGRLVAVPAQGYRSAGEHEVLLCASGIATGTYIYRLEAGAQTASRAFVLTR